MICSKFSKIFQNTKSICMKKRKDLDVWRWLRMSMTCCQKNKSMTSTRSLYRPTNYAFRSVYNHCLYVWRCWSWFKTEICKLSFSYLFGLARLSHLLIFSFYDGKWVDSDDLVLTHSTAIGFPKLVLVDSFVFTAPKCNLLVYICPKPTEKLNKKHNVFRLLRHWSMVLASGT